MRLIARVIGFLCIAAGFVALVVDGTRTIANDTWMPTPLGDIAARTFPAIYADIGPTISRSVHPLLWDPILISIFTAPAFVVALGLGFALMILARRRREDIGFSTKR